MKITHSLLLPRDAVTVPAVRRLCRSAMEELGVVPGDIDDVTLALTEACANVVEHSALGDADYEVGIAISAEVCEITVVDTGVGFEPDLEAPFDAGLGERGRGLPLMRSLVDVAELRSRPAVGTAVRLVKALTLSEDAMLRMVVDRTGKG